MFKAVAVWLFVMGLLADGVLVILKNFDWISWGWDVIIAIPFALAFVGTLVFAIFYGILKFIITLIMLF